MKQNLSVNLLGRLKELNFTLDEIIIELGRVFTEREMHGIIEVNFEFIDENLVNNISTAVIAKMKRENCYNEKWHSHGWTTNIVKKKFRFVTLRSIIIKTSLVSGMC